MPRTYVKKVGSRHYRNYTDETLEKALLDVATGRMSIRKSSKVYRISRVTLTNKVRAYNMHSDGASSTNSTSPHNPGGQAVLTREDEKVICSHIVKMDLFGFPVSHLELRLFVQTYLNDLGRKVRRFSNNLPGKDWASSFVARHSHVTYGRMSRNVKRECQALGQTTLNQYARKRKGNDPAGEGTTLEDFIRQVTQAQPSGSAQPLKHHSKHGRQKTVKTNNKAVAMMIKSAQSLPESSEGDTSEGDSISYSENEESVASFLGLQQGYGSDLSNFEEDECDPLAVDEEARITESTSSFSSSAEENGGILGLLNPEMVMVDVKEEANEEHVFKEELDFKVEFDVIDELPSGNYEKIVVNDQNDPELTTHGFDNQESVKEEEILVKSELCNCDELCNCAKSETLPDSDGDMIDVENMEPLLITQNQAEIPESNSLNKISFHEGPKYEKIGVNDRNDPELTTDLFDSQVLAKEEEILVKSELCECDESCNCAKSETLPDSDGEMVDVENMEPLLITQNHAEVPGSNRPKKLSFHKDLKYFYCDGCDYKSPQLGHMEYHMRKHTGEKPLACGHCDYRASHPTTLTRHVRSQHTGEKPYSCKLCDYKAAQPGALARHMRTHTGEKPYACDWCNFRTADLSTIYVHKTTHTGEQPFKCQLCGFGARRKRGLRRHFIREHPEAPPLPFLMVKPLSNIQNADYSKSKVRSRNFKGEWWPGTEYMSSGSESDDEQDCAVDVDSDTNVDVGDWALPEASSSGRRIKVPKRLDL